jgi:hypothetical protein
MTQNRGLVLVQHTGLCPADRAGRIWPDNPQRRRRGIFLETPAKTKFKPVGAAYSGMSLLRSLIHLESQNYNDASLTGLPANPIASFQPGRRAIFPLRQPELGRGRKARWGRAPLRGSAVAFLLKTRICHEAAWFMREASLRL